MYIEDDHHFELIALLHQFRIHSVAEFEVDEFQMNFVLEFLH